MSEIKITIENCNNISKGVISLEEEKLNIRYGMNGTGKSTLSTAISLFSQGKPMDDLKPFGSDDEVIPTISIDGDIQGVRVFNEDFVNNMVFKESMLIIQKCHRQRFKRGVLKLRNGYRTLIMMNYIGMFIMKRN